MEIIVGKNPIICSTQPTALLQNLTAMKAKFPVSAINLAETGQQLLELFGPVFLPLLSTLMPDEMHSSEGASERRNGGWKLACAYGR